MQQVAKMFLKSDTTRQRFSQRLAQPRFGPLWFSPRAPRLGAEKKAPTTFDRPPPRRGWGADYSEPRHLGCYGARKGSVNGIVIFSLGTITLATFSAAIQPVIRMAHERVAS